MGHDDGEVVVDSAHSWKLVLAVILLGAILGGICARPPRHSVARVELRRLVLAAVALYAVGLLASLAGRGELAGLVYAAGIMICSLAVWLSRGMDADDPPSDGHGGDESPIDDGPPGFPVLDWDEFERELRSYADRGAVTSRS
jgi:hypothetical protein